ncbi:MAG TPA: thiamine pyrophosphate-dependent enzyme [Candidatus Bathyarchaeia archaeon]|nr:thiamine pyrophosphate-dependent enzyme [Candidatus Bathyarchaeia archaeon]
MTQEYVSYRNARPYPFCPGCSHSSVMDHLNSALVKLQFNPTKIVIVTDIGCSGLSDQYFTTNAFHGLHGRAITYATGMKLANPELKIIVIIGDGGCGIGGHHLINAARRNIGMTVLVLNNFNYGMTGGQHSVTTPHGGITPTTRLGNLERPLDIAGTVALNGATFVVRTTSFDNALPQLIEQAIAREGFSLLDIWELCAAYYVPNNTFNRAQLERLMVKIGFQRGIIHNQEREEYSLAYRNLATSDMKKTKPNIQAGLNPVFKSTLNRTLRLVIAGGAGQKIASAASLLGTAAVLSNLWATKRDNYPVTVMTGHSVSEVILSPVEIFYTGIDKPDVFLALAPEGMRECKRQLDSLTSDDILYVRKELLPVQTDARIVPLDLSRMPRKEVTLAAIGTILKDLNLMPRDALREAIRIVQSPKIASESLRALERSATLHESEH